MAVSRLSLDLGLERLSQFEVRSETTSRLGATFQRVSMVCGYSKMKKNTSHLPRISIGGLAPEREGPKLLEVSAVFN
jgi:hypothetical protein